MSNERRSGRSARRGMPATFAVTTALALAVLALDAHGATETPPAPTAIEFLDVRTVEHTHFLERRVTPVQRYEHNPIIPGANDIATVLKGKDGVIRMWYKSKVPVPGLPPGSPG